MKPTPTPEMIEAALHARVPGGAEVWAWLPQKDAWTPHETARDVMHAALSAALSVPAAAVVGEPVAECDHKGPLHYFSWGPCCKKCGEPYPFAAREEAAAPTTPQGWQLVPVEINDAMTEAYYSGIEDGPGSKVWKAMLAAAPSAPEGWQPIETAPKGPEILLFEQCDEMPATWVGRWFDPDFEDGYWTDTFDLKVAGHPTHWRPLPAPPALGGSK